MSDTPNEDSVLQPNAQPADRPVVDDSAADTGTADTGATEGSASEADAGHADGDGARANPGDAHPGNSGPVGGAPTDRPGDEGRRGDATPPREGRPMWQRALIGFAQHFAAAGLAVALPMFDVLGDNPTFFVARGASGGSVVSLTVALLLLPASVGFVIGAALWFIGRAVGGERGARIGWTLSIAAWATIIALPYADDALRNTPLLALLVACGFALVIAFGYLNNAWMRTGLAALAPVPIVFAGLFLFSSGVSGIVRPANAATESAAVAGDTNVVVLIFDEMTLAPLLNSNLDIDAQRFPNIADLASRSTWYRNATTSQPQTYKAIPSLLSGRYLEGDLPNISVWPNNLFTLLDADYEITAYEPLTQLCVTACDVRGATTSFGDDSLGSMLDDISVVYKHIIYPTKWQSGLPRIDTGWGNFDGVAAEGQTDDGQSDASTGGQSSGDAHDDSSATDSSGSDGAPPESTAQGAPTSTTQFTTPDGQPVEEWTFDDIQTAIQDARSDRDLLFAEFLDTLNGAKTGNLWFNHSVLPHEPIEFLPDGRTYPLNGDPATVYGSNWWYEPQAVPDRQLQAYMVQLEYVDKLIGDFLTRMDEQNLWDDSIVVVTADHGVSFWAGQQRRWSSPDNFEDLARVPLFIHLPDQTPGQVSDRNVEGVDVLPTILDDLGVDNTTIDFEGTSLLDEGAPERPVKLMWPYGSGGSPREFDGAWPGKLRLQEHIVDIFGTPSGEVDPWAMGPYRNLVGTEVSDAEVGPDASATVTLIDGARYNDMNPDIAHPYATAPASVTGSLPQGTDVVVAANGVIVGSGNVIVDRSENPLISPMVRPDRFDRGKNTIAFYTVDGDPAAPVLHLIPESS